jgi:hypothetical protein
VGIDIENGGCYNFCVKEFVMKIRPMDNEKAVKMLQCLYVDKDRDYVEIGMAVKPFANGVFSFSPEFVEGRRVYGLITEEGFLVVPPYYHSIVRVDDNLAVTYDASAKTWGLFELKQGNKIVPQAYQYVEIEKHGEDARFVHFYKGVNCFTLDCENVEAGLKINPYISERMLKILKEDPSQFFALDTVYFIDPATRSYSTANETLLVLAARAGHAEMMKEAKRNELLPFGSIKMDKEFQKRMSAKIAIERAKLGCDLKEEEIFKVGRTK